MAQALQMAGITKYFPSSNVLANNKVDFSVAAGEVHALVGENGAGKTTLMNILYGLHRPDEGQITVGGQPVTITHPDDAIRLGIGMVHQHFKLVPSFTIAQNIMLGIEPHRLGFLQQQHEAQQVRQLAAQFGLPVNPDELVRDLPVGMQQRVEILKLLQRDAKILILDEPTAVLTPQEVDELLHVVRRLAQRGRTVIFITHKLLEVKNVADRVSIMRNGKMVGTRVVAQTTVPEMAGMMVGRSVVLQIDKQPAAPGEPVLAVQNVTVASASGVPAVRRLSLHVRAREILGVAGVSGNGQTELVEAITGMRAIEGGAIHYRGRPISRHTVGQRRRLGMAHIPEDRLRVGLNLDTNLDENLIVNRYRQPGFSRLGFLLRGAIRRFAQKTVRDFSISGARPGAGIATLSGGNMQKVVLGRELAGEPQLVIANQPTRGLDVGSIEFVHRTLIQCRDAGAAVLLVSVELDEVLSLSDRIIVLYRGQIAGELHPAAATERDIGLLMGGGALPQTPPGRPAATQTPTQGAA